MQQREKEILGESVAAGLNEDIQVSVITPMIL